MTTLHTTGSPVELPKVVSEPSKLTALAGEPLTDQSAAWKVPFTGSLVVTTIEVVVFVLALLNVGATLSMARSGDVPVPVLLAASLVFTVMFTVPDGRAPEFRVTVPPRTPWLTV